VGGTGWSTNAGRAYIFYNGSIATENASGADVLIDGDASSVFGARVGTGDINNDGRVDLFAAESCSGCAGDIFIFYNDGSIPTTAATADIKLVGDSGSSLGSDAIATGDFNADGKIDLVASAHSYSSNVGKVAFFEGRNNFSWQLQSQTLSASRIYPNVLGEEITVTGAASGYFGYKMAAGDLNADGATDIVISAPYENTNTGRVYIFYSDGSYGDSATNADVVITGQATGDYFGYDVATGDLNADGKTDLIVGTQLYATNTGRVYIFYNDGIYPGSADNADVFITGEATSNGFSSALITGDFNADGKVDLAVGAYAWTTNTGRAYVFYNDGTVNFGTASCSGTPAACAAANADAIISGEATSDNLGWSLGAGDFNADGKVDLAAGAYGYHASNYGRAYIFYNGSIITENASGANVFFTGVSASDAIGYSIEAVDINFDGETDLVAGAGYKVFIYYNDGTYGAADVTITSGSGDNFGDTLAVGDLNADGRVDLVVGADSYSSLTGRAYIFYNDGSIPTTEATADVMITGQGTSNYFATTLVTGDFNLDGKIDLATAGKGYLTDKGRLYIYTMNDSATAGESSSSFGTSLTTADFNADGKMDLAVGAYAYSGSTGRTYVFYGGGALDVSASSADVIITGESSSQFGNSLVASDLNADGKADLAVGANGYNPGAAASTGRAYIFYNGSIITEAATGADVIITGTAVSNNFGYALTTGDLNADGEIDLAVGAYGANAAYIFYNDGSYPTTAGTANVTITGASDFGISLTTGDLNADGEVDLAVGAYSVSSNAGAIYIFYNDGSIPTTAGTADVTITGEASSRIGYPVITGDFNADGKTDLASAAYYYSSVTGRVYIFHNDGSIPTTAATADVIITGETASDNFGSNLASGDLNADGRTDLAIGAHQYSSGAGRSYTFYNDGSIPTTAAAADIISTGGSGSLFGWSLAIGDLNQDSIADLLVGAPNSAGKVHILITEITTPTANSTTQTPDGNTKSATLKSGTIKVKGGNIQVK
jgi:hypothetical protein